MPQRLAKTKKHRHLKTKKAGAAGKHARENHGTTPSIPVTGELPTLRFGRKVKAESVSVPKN